MNDCELPPNWRCTYRPPSRASRPWSAEKVAGVLAKLCRDRGADEAERAVALARMKCNGEQSPPSETVCSAIDASIDLMSYWQREIEKYVVGGFILEVWQLWADAVEQAKAFGIIIPPPPDVYGLVQLLQDIRSGAQIERLKAARKKAGCYSTGGGF